METKEWFRERRMVQAAGQRLDPTVDVRQCPAYYKQHDKTSGLTLERALRDKTGVQWQKYHASVMELLGSNGFPMAAMRWT